MRISKTIQILIVGLCLIAGALFAISDRDSGAQNNERTMNLKSYLLNSFLNELPDINSKLPYQIDKNTVLLSIEYADGKILTRYKVPNQKFQIDSDQRFTKEMISKLQKQVCLDETKKGLINVDVDFLSQYQDALGQVMFEFLTNRSTCLAINLAH